jgi:hypothetical protein
MYDCDSPIFLDAEGGNLVYMIVIELPEPDALGGRVSLFYSSINGWLPMEWRQAQTIRQAAGPIETDVRQSRNSPLLS